MLKDVGNFIELGYEDHPSPPSLVAGKGKRCADNKTQVVAYLRSGVTLVFSPGRDLDVLDASKVAGTASVLTDGAYAWPSTLAYYVDTYDVELPVEFERHMQRNQWEIPAAIDRTRLELPTYSK